MVVHTKEELGPTSAEKNRDVYAELDAIERSSFLLNSIADKQEIVIRVGPWKEEDLISSSA